MFKSRSCIHSVQVLSKQTLKLVFDDSPINLLHSALASVIPGHLESQASHPHFLLLTSQRAFIVYYFVLSRQVQYISLHVYISAVILIYILHMQTVYVKFMFLLWVCENLRQSVCFKGLINVMTVAICDEFKIFEDCLKIRKKVECNYKL